MLHWLAKLVCIPTHWPRQRSSFHAGVSEAPNLAALTSAATQIAPTSYFPWLPPALVFLILSIVWDTLQTAQERSAFVENATLVNRTWLTLVAYITSRDVHIHTGEDGIIFARRLSKDPGRVADLFTMMKMRVTNAICRSVTFHVHDTLSYAPWCTVIPELIPHPASSRAAVSMSNAIAVFLHSLAKPGDPHWAACL